MSLIERIRAYHAVLAMLAVAAFVTGEAGAIHAWLGYAIALVILGRLVASLSGLKQLGLARFYPQFEGLNLGTLMTHPAISKSLLAGIAASLIAVTVTGIHLDGGRTLGFGAPALVATGEHEGGIVGEAHEVFANLLVVLVGLHVLYLVTCKRGLVRFMLFLRPAGRPAGPR
ncbi:MAG: cytochrome b/b6 domain-containing protein [Paracraurococcus sp.]